MVYTTKISKDMDLSKVVNCPTFVQQYINKKYEVRTIIIGKKIFGVKIDMQDLNKDIVDYRVLGKEIYNLKHTVIEIPLTIQTLLFQYMSALGLLFGVADFVVDQNNDWFFLDINASGEYYWTEQLTGINISDYFAGYLISPVP
jgi:hypothetical protein